MNGEPDGCMGMDCTGRPTPKPGDTMDIPGGRIIRILEVKAVSSAHWSYVPPTYRATHKAWFEVVGFRK